MPVTPTDLTLTKQFKIRSNETDISGFLRPGALVNLLIQTAIDSADELGFGLDLSKCAATGNTDDLIYVSPKSGKAVSGEAGAPYKGMLLALPAFVQGGQGHAAPKPGEICDGFKLTNFFLQRDVLTPRGLSMPQSRERVISTLQDQADAGGNFSGI